MKQGKFAYNELVEKLLALIRKIHQKLSLNGLLSTDALKSRRTHMTITATHISTGLWMRLRINTHELAHIS